MRSWNKPKEEQVAHVMCGPSRNKSRLIMTCVNSLRHHNDLPQRVHSKEDHFALHTS